MNTPTLDQMKTHLEFLGYQISQDEKRIMAHHNTKCDFTIRPLQGGFIFTAIFTGNQNAKGDKASFLDFINSLNNEAVLARFSADKDSDFFIEAWHPPSYERVAFAAFLDVLDQDFQRFLKLGAEEFIQ